MSNFSLYHPANTNPEEVGLVQGRWFTHQTLSSYFQNLTTSETLGHMPEDQAVDAHHLETTHTIPIQGMEMDGATYLLPPHPGSYEQASTNLTYPHEGMESTPTSHGWMGSLPHQHLPQPSPTPFRVGEPLNPIHRAQDSPMTDGGYFEVRQSPQEANYNLGHYNGEGQGHPGFVEPCQPHRAIAEPQARFVRTLETPTLSHRSDEERHADWPPSPSPVIEENQMMAPVAAESFTAKTNRNRARFRNRKKKPYERKPECKKKRKPGKKTQNLEPQEYVPAEPFTPLPTRPDLRAVQQPKYKCDSTQKDWEPLPPIDFAVRGKEGIKEGINLDDALNMTFSDLEGRDDPMFVVGQAGNSVSLRIKLMRHQPCSEKAPQIATKNHRRERGPITRQKLGYEVAKLIDIHLEDGSPFDVPWEDMYLVRLHNVSLASWQPELWCKPSTTS